jgi:hypothetical protein
LNRADFEKKEGGEDGHGDGSTGIRAGFVAFFSCRDEAVAGLISNISQNL